MAARLLYLAPFLGSAFAAYIPRTDLNAPLPQCESWESNGFHHPGVYHDCKSLDRIQANYQSKKWAYIEGLDSVIARANALSNDSWVMQGPFEEVNWAGGDGHNIPLQEDGKSTYMLTLGWYATGNTKWLDRAKNVVLKWASTLHILNEHIQGGEGLAYLTASADIMRATSKQSGWSAENTAAYLIMIESIVAPWNETEGLTSNSFFMNQGFYGNNGAMTVAVFSENRTMYDDMVYHATVGANPDATLDYAIPIQISGEPEYYGQVTEMGRDEYHPMGTLRGLCYMGHTSKVQGAVDFFNLDNGRLLAGWEYWATYNNGTEVPWEPRRIRPTGTEWYNATSPLGRGRNYEQYPQPVEAIGVGYYEYFERGLVDKMPNLAIYMSWQGVGWSTFEWGFDSAIAHLGYSLKVVNPCKRDD